MTENHQYVTGIALSQFIYGAKSLGIDTHDALKLAGLGKEHLNPSARVPGSKYEAALLTLLLANKNANFGIDIGQQIMPPLYGVLMSLALSSSSLGDALKYLARYQGLATGNCGDVKYALIEENYQLSIEMTHQNAVIRRHVSECVMIMFCGLLKLITSRQDLSPIEIRLEHVPYSKTTQRYFESIAGCQVIWGFSETQMILSKKIHDFEIYGHGDELLRVAEKQARFQLELINKKMSDLEKIKWHVSQLMLSGTPRREIVATRLQISTRTLDRKLLDAGVSWQEIVDGLRLQKALKYLSDGDKTISEVSQKLGFTEIRAFQKRFKLWTGLTPTAYRKEVYKL